jgi:hypothetical protein
MGRWSESYPNWTAHFKKASLMNSADRKALKQKYLECFGVRATNMTAWKLAVKELTDQGVSRETLGNKTHCRQL